jgi:hypothetical protein
MKKSLNQSMTLRLLTFIPAISLPGPSIQAMKKMTTLALTSTRLALHLHPHL